MRNQRRHHPLLFPLTHWHWKAALLTVIFRAAACMAALCHTSLHAREHFGIVEAAYVLATAGIFSAWQQQALQISPRRIGWCVVVFAVPLSSLAADSLLHLWLDHANMRSLGVSALVFTLLSAMFHWHVMQNGAMRVGSDSHTFVEDMRCMPRLALTFVTDPARVILARLRPDPAIAEAEDFEAAA